MDVGESQSETLLEISNLKKTSWKAGNPSAVRLCGYWASKNNSDFSHISACSEITSFTFMFNSKILKSDNFEKNLSVEMHLSVEFQ